IRGCATWIFIDDDLLRCRFHEHPYGSLQATRRQGLLSSGAGLWMSQPRAAWMKRKWTRTLIDSRIARQGGSLKPARGSPIRRQVKRHTPPEINFFICFVSTRLICDL